MVGGCVARSVLVVAGDDVNHGAVPGEREVPWLNRGVGGIGAASFLADVGHEIPTALLPSFLTSTLGASASALGLIEGISDGLAGGARIVGGALADDPERRRVVAVGGYTTTAALGALVGAASSVAQVAVLRAGSWLARGLRVPARNALLADLAPPEVYGRAYGFERTMDNLGAIVGPLLALVLVGLVGTREAIYLSIIPGLLAALAIIYAIRNTKAPKRAKRTPIRIRIRPVLQGRLRPLMGGITAFEVGNVAATLLILRATDLLEPGRSHDGAVQLAIALYIAYNVAATLGSYPAGHVSDRIGPTRVMLLGVAFFGLAYAGFAINTDSVVLLGLWFVLAGFAIGCVETAEHAAVASDAPTHLRGSAFGLLAGVQSFGNLAASAVAGVIWTAISPTAAFVYLTAWMVIAAALFIRARELELTTAQGETS